MKKITIFSLHLEVGGIERFVALLSTMLSSSYKIEIICTYKGIDKPAFDIPGNVKIKYLIDDKIDKISAKKLLKEHRYILFIKEMLRRIKNKYLSRKLNIEEIKNLNTDIVITTRIYHNELVSKYLKNKKIVKIATEHNHHQNNQKYISNIVNSVKNFDYLVVATNELHEFYKDKIDKTKSIIIPNFIENIPSKKTDFNNQNIISVGRFSPEKGFLDLIDVVELIHKKNKYIKCYLIGDGFEKSKIINKINEKNLEDAIVLPGYLSISNQEKYYLDSSIYVMTSHTEAFGIVLLEAMSYGLPCVAFDSASGARENITKKIGILIPNRDINKMADMILNLINEKSKLLNYQKEVTKNINMYTIDSIKEKWHNLLK